VLRPLANAPYTAFRIQRLDETAQQQTAKAKEEQRPLKSAFSSNGKAKEEQRRAEALHRN